MSDYTSFLERKAMTAPTSGMAEVPPLGDYLFPFQRDCVEWALRRGKAALFEAVGLGKTRQIGEFVAQASAYLDARGERSEGIIVSPLGVAAQTVRELVSIGIDAKYCKGPEDIERGAFTVTNYDRLDRFNVARFGVGALDECFSPETEVDVVFKDATVRPVRIDAIRAGAQILNASGVDTVAATRRREVPYAVRVTIGDRRIVASPNHPFFTKRGWVGAGRLNPWDEVLECAEAMRMVRGRVSAEVATTEGWEVLQSILLSEMAHAAAGDPGEGSQSGGCGEAWTSKGGMDPERKPGSRRGIGKDHGAEPHDAPGSTGEGITTSSRDRSLTIRAWRQWARHDGTAEDHAGSARLGVEAGIHGIAGPENAGVSDALQVGSGASGSLPVHRSRRAIALQPEGHRREAGRKTGFARVDRVEVLECGHPEVERLRSPDGKLYFYDLEATRHPSFSVSGILVHNSSILKHDTSATRIRIIQAFKDTRFIVSATATPSPNDRKELGGQSELLGVMTEKEMLSDFFVHDAGNNTWRLKGHAEGRFWQWVASWGAMITKPSDLGYADTGYDLPKLHIFDHPTPASIEQDRIIHADVAQLAMFARPARGLKKQSKARRLTLTERVAAAVEVILAEPHEQWLVWCALNDESDELIHALAAAIPGAVEIQGKHSSEKKEAAALGFANGSVRALVSKIKIFGYGLNFQNCARACFVGPTHSFEDVHQALGRYHRFGQRRECHAHFVYSELEGPVRENLRRKQAEFAAMADAMRGLVAGYVQQNVRGTSRDVTPYHPNMPMVVAPWLTSECA